MLSRRRNYRVPVVAEVLGRLRSDLGRRYEQPQVPRNGPQVNRVYATIRTRPTHDRINCQLPLMPFSNYIETCYKQIIANIDQLNLAAGKGEVHVQHNEKGNGATFKVKCTVKYPQSVGVECFLTRVLATAPRKK